jgi:hypothetical protein
MPTVGRSRETLGECGGGVLGELMQFDLQGGRHDRAAVTKFSNLGLEGSYPAAQPGDLERQRLIGSTAYVTQQGACHVATFRGAERRRLE